jgi:hypothetical protein
VSVCGKPVFCVHLVEFDKEDFSVALLSCEDVYICDVDDLGIYYDYYVFLLSLRSEAYWRARMHVWFIWHVLMSGR